ALNCGSERFVGLGGLDHVPPSSLCPAQPPQTSQDQGMSDSNENQTSSYMAVALSSGARSRFRCTDLVRQAPVLSGTTSVADVSDAPRHGINHAGMSGLNSNPD